MTDVLAFPRSQRDLIWVCECGCSSFEIHGDSTVACCLCEKPLSGPKGAWFEEIRHGRERDPDLEAPVRDLNGNGSIEFARRRMADIAARDDLASIVCVRRDGTIHAWSEAETKDQVSWVRRHIKAGAKMLRDGRD